MSQQWHEPEPADQAGRAGRADQARPRPGYSGGYGPAGEPAPELSPADQRLWSTVVHAAGSVLLLVSPLIGYLALRERGIYVRAQTAEALNFQLTAAVLQVVAVVLAVVTFGLLSFLPFLVWVVTVVFSVVAAVRSSHGDRYRYPLTLRLVR